MAQKLVRGGGRSRRPRGGRRLDGAALRLVLTGDVAEPFLDVNDFAGYAHGIAGTGVWSLDTNGELR